MKLLLSSIVLVTLTVCAQSSVENESNTRVLKSAKGYKTLKSGKSVKVQKSMKSDKVGKAAKSESGPSMSSSYIYMGFIDEETRGVLKVFLENVIRDSVNEMIDEETRGVLKVFLENVIRDSAAKSLYTGIIDEETRGVLKVFLENVIRNSVNEMIDEDTRGVLKVFLENVIRDSFIRDETLPGSNEGQLEDLVGESGPSISSTYIYHIVKAMLDLNEPTGSSLSAIEKNIKASLPSTKKWGNTTFLTALKSMVTAGDLLEGKDDSGRSTYIYFGVGKAPSMSSTYIYLIVKAIFVLNEPTGSSLSAIEKNVQASLPSTTKYGRGTFLTALKSMVTAGDLQKVKDDSGRSTYIYRH